MNVWRQASAERWSRVVLADPDPVARRRMRDQLQVTPDLIVAADVGRGVNALELITHYRPDIAVLELFIPPLDGIELTRRISDDLPGVRVLIHSACDEVDVQLRAFRAGAAGFLAKGSAPGVLAAAARALIRGEAVVPRQLATIMVEQLRSLPRSGNGMRPIRSPLTSREWEVADLMAQGMDTKQIAAELVLSEDTVYTHIKHILRKLGVHSREDAIAAANRLRTPGM